MILIPAIIDHKRVEARGQIININDGLLVTYAVRIR